MTLDLKISELYQKSKKELYTSFKSIIIDELLELIHEYYWSVNIMLSWNKNNFQMPDSSFIEQSHRYNYYGRKELKLNDNTCDKMFSLGRSFYYLTPRRINIRGFINFSENRTEHTKVFGGKNSLFIVGTDRCTVTEITERSSHIFKFDNEIEKIYSNENGCVALTINGHIYVWWKDGIHSATLIMTDAVSVFNTPEFFVVVKKNGSTVPVYYDARENVYYNINVFSPVFYDQLKTITNITDIKSNLYATAVLTNGQIKMFYTHPVINFNHEFPNNVIKIFSNNNYSFVALTSLRTVYRWGINQNFEIIVLPSLIDIKEIVSNDNSFLAFSKDNSTIYTWNNVSSSLYKREDETVISVHNTAKTFSVLYSSKTVVTVQHVMNDCIIKNIMHGIEYVVSCSRVILGVRKNGKIQLYNEPDD